MSAQAVEVSLPSGGSSPMPKHTAVRFTLPNGDKLDCAIEDGALEVRSIGFGRRGSVHVVPQAANVVRIVAGEWPT